MSGSPPEARSTSRVAFMLRALRYPNYRLFFGGQIVSLTGTWITTTATSWLVYRLTGSAVYLGVIGFATQFPAFLLTSVAGIYVDRWNRHRLLVATQVLMMLVSTVLAALTLTGHVTIPAIVAVSVVQGLVTAFDLPCRQAFVVSIIEDRNDIGNAIALNSSMFNAARLIGPSVAGAIIAAFGEGWCFALDGVSYVAVIIALLMMKLPPHQQPASHRQSVFSQFKEGWTYVFGSPVIRAIIVLLALVSLVGVPYTILMPVFAGDVLKGGPSTLGLLMTASGGGALLGALWLASRQSAAGLMRAIPFAAGAFGVGLVALSFARSIWLAIVFMVLAGFGLMVQAATSNTVLQTVVEDEKRGRVMSFFLMAYLGSAPFGSLIAGTLSERLGVAATLGGGGICCVAAAIWFFTKLPTFGTVVVGHTLPATRSLDTEDSISIHTSSAH